MSSNNAPIDLQIGDFVDLEAQPHQAKIVVTITPQCIQLKDPLATHIDVELPSFRIFCTDPLESKGSEL
jgi:hypothetical protein